MAKTDRCVVRNQAYRKSGLGIRERHNERKNIGYANKDIELNRSALNVHFKQCMGTYTEEFDRLVKDGIISTRGLKQDAKVIDEMVFDVNSFYFDQNGGYEYAKGFFEEAYRMAVKEAGGEQFILSAVMHADERNQALSEKLGRDIYHYHLHVVYVPVVNKEIKWSKRCKNPALVGTTKEVIKQVSHSKKWSSELALDENGSVIRNENGRAVLINAYSLLQDRFFEHMQLAGFCDFQRGERGSKANHLDVLNYKIRQDKKRLERLNNSIEGKEQQAVKLEISVKQAEKRLVGLEQRFNVTENAYATYNNLENMGKKKIRGRIELNQEEFSYLLTLAKSGLASQGVIEELRRNLIETGKRSVIYRTRWQELQNQTTDYIKMVELYPEKTKAAMETLKELQGSVSIPKKHQYKR